MQDNDLQKGTRKVKLSELEKENDNKKVTELKSNSNSNSQNKKQAPKEKDINNKELNKDKKVNDINDNKSAKKVVPLSEVAKQNQDKINKTVKASSTKTSSDNKKDNKGNDNDGDEKSQSKKVKLDDLLKETKEKETKKKKEEDVIVSFNDKKQEAKNNIKKNKAINEKDKEKANRNLKEISGKKDDDNESKTKSSKEHIIDETKKSKKHEVEPEINLDPLGVKRKKDLSPIFDKIKEIGITVLLFIVGILIIMVLPIFNVSPDNVNITGLDLIDRNEILDVINYNKYNNLFYLLLNNPKEKIIENIPMVNDCEVKFELPNSLNIRITEIRLAGYIPYLEEYIYIDSYGKVVSSEVEKIDGIPLIEGLNFTSFKVGNILKVSNQDALKIIIEITNVLNKYNLSNLIDSIDVTSLDNLKLYVGNIEVVLGEIEDYDQKIRNAMEAINNLSPEARGILNVSSSSGKIYFMPYS